MSNQINEARTGKIFTEKQLRYLSRAIMEDIKGKNPYEKRNVFKYGQFKTQHIVKGLQFGQKGKCKSWCYADYSSPKIEKLGHGRYKFFFDNIDFKSESIIFSSRIDANELYVLISGIHDAFMYHKTNNTIDF